MTQNCPNCGAKISGNGKHPKTGAQRYRCSKKCGWFDNAPIVKNGKPALGDRAMTVAERVRRHRAKKKLNKEAKQ